MTKQTRLKDGKFPPVSITPGRSVRSLQTSAGETTHHPRDRRCFGRHGQAGEF
jgi:hypothetical protein